MYKDYARVRECACRVVVGWYGESLRCVLFAARASKRKTATNAFVMLVLPMQQNVTNVTTPTEFSQGAQASTLVPRDMERRDRAHHSERVHRRNQSLCRVAERLQHESH